MKKIVISLIFISFVFCFFGQEVTDDKKTISFDEYIEIIKEKIPELKINENSVELAENEVYKANSTYDPELSGSFSGIGKKTYPESPGSEIWYSSGFNGNVDVSATAPSGTRLSLGFDYSQMYSNGMATNNQTGKQTQFLLLTRDPVIKVKIAQPLVFNWFGFLDRFAKKDAKMKLAIEKLKKLENDKEVINYYKKLYFFWYQWDQILTYLKTTIDNAKRLEAQTAEKLRTGVAENDEYQRARYAVFKYQEQYNQTMIEYKNIINELNLFIDTELVIPEIVINGSNEKDDFTLFYETAINSNFDFVEFENTTNSKILNLNKENLEYLKKVSFNKTLPQFNLFGNIDIKFHEYHNLPTGGDAGDSAEEDYKFYYGNTVYGYTDEKDGYFDKYESEINKYPNLDFVAGIEFRYPLGNFKARGDLKETQLRLKDLLLQYEVTRNNYTKGLNNLITSIDLIKKTIEEKNKSIESLRSRYNTEKRKYNQARLELRNLLDTENNITDEEINLMMTKANMIMLYFDYLKITQ